MPPILRGILEARLYDDPRISILQSLDDRSCDVLVEWPRRAKYGVQLKSNGDVEKNVFGTKTMVEIQDSRQHSLERLYFVLGADTGGVANSQKVRGLNEPHQRDERSLCCRRAAGERLEPAVRAGRAMKRRSAPRGGHND